MTQPCLFPDHTAERERITAAIAGQFACYGQGTAPTRAAVGLSLKDQPPTFAFGVDVRTVVDAVLDLAGALPLPIEGARE